MLSAVIKPALDLCRDGMAAWKRRRNPACAQAQRLLDAFAAHGVAGVQIPRLLPEALALPNAAFADADDLKDKLTPRLLDWAADTWPFAVVGWMALTPSAIIACRATSTRRSITTGCNSGRNFSPTSIASSTSSWPARNR
ncbi:hypothetical protein GCM10009126_06820 [Rhodanobacter caeni]|uniref:Uncharacterized protein n=1 Tax=Rhodanobacter caeni TaxID=657654 RepID=A0ABP3DYI7_9GAMM